jgi:hypothetical protein
MYSLLTTVRTLVALARPSALASVAAAVVLTALALAAPASAAPPPAPAGNVFH